MKYSDKTALEIVESNIRYMKRNPELIIDKADALPEEDNDGDSRISRFAENIS